MFKARGRMKKQKMLDNIIKLTGTEKPSLRFIVEDDIIIRKREAASLEEAIFKEIEIKDMKTANHCKAVAAFAYLLAEKLGLCPDDVRMAYKCGLFHDIGKLMVDNAVLYKKEKLTANEYHQIREHARKGMMILEAFNMPDKVVDAAWHHHEYFNGGGYPDGLEGKEIKFMTQIISVADCMDAMLKNRAYRKALSPDRMINELKSGSGKQFNPEIVEAAAEIGERIKEG